MNKRDVAGLSDEDGESKTLTWRERLGSLFRRSRVKEQARSPESLIAAMSDSPSLPLSVGELDSLRSSYLRHLCDQFRSLHLYGLDERRRSVQQDGQLLDLLALYTPLNTTVDASIEPERGTEPGTPLSGTQKTRVLSLLEAVGGTCEALVRGAHGSGKSTFLRFLALSLAEQSPEGERTGIERLGETWTHGWMFPLLVDLRDFAASSYDDGTAQGLCAFIAAELGIYSDQLCTQVILPGGVLFLLDGLERAPAATADFVTCFREPLPQTSLPGSEAQDHKRNCFVVTGQPYLDLDDEFLASLGSFTEIQLAPWTLPQMDDFVQRWYVELERRGWIDEESVRDLPGQLCSALRRAEVRSLTQRPSMMTLVALLQTLRGRLPADRGLFYHELIDFVLAYWSEGRTEQERDLGQVFDIGSLRAAVAHATYQGYTRLERSTELVELPIGDLRATLVTVCRDGRWEAVEDLVERISTRLGLLDESRPGVYTFLEISLQAYVASRYLVEQPDLSRLIVRLSQDDFYRWREVILFAIGRLAWLQGARSAAIDCVEALCAFPFSGDDRESISVDQWRMAWLAGEAMNAITGERAHSSGQRSGTGQAQSSGQKASETVDVSRTVARVQERLVALLERGVLTPRERAQAGSMLDRLPGGDPRPGVSGPDLLWCEIPACPFWRGEGEASLMAEMDDFWISRYPVTNAQYAAFVRVTGHPAPRYWRGDSPPVGMGNHPVVDVTWNDVTRYCEWWVKRMRAGSLLVWRAGRVSRRDRVPGQWTVRLPTSDEWEKSARGGLLVPVPGKENVVDNPFPRRIYPWGDSWGLSMGENPGDETRCNVSESNMGATTPVGMYPDGASPYGVMDIAGNVWEWVLDWADKEKRYKIRRGGAFRYTHDHARCSAWDKAHPDLAWPYMGFRVVLGPAVLDLD